MIVMNFPEAFLFGICTPPRGHALGAGRMESVAGRGRLRR